MRGPSRLGCELRARRYSRGEFHGAWMMPVLFLFLWFSAVWVRPLEARKHDPLTREQFKVYDVHQLDRSEPRGWLDAIVNLTDDSFDCLGYAMQPISNVESRHRSVTVCHLGKILMWPDRRLKWDTSSETLGNDAQASKLLRREQRQGVEVV